MRKLLLVVMVFVLCAVTAIAVCTDYYSDCYYQLTPNAGGSAVDECGNNDGVAQNFGANLFYDTEHLINGLPTWNVTTNGGVTISGFDWNQNFCLGMWMIPDNLATADYLAGNNDDAVYFFIESGSADWGVRGSVIVRAGTDQLVSGNTYNLGFCSEGGSSGAITFFNNGVVVGTASENFATTSGILQLMRMSSGFGVYSGEYYSIGRIQMILNFTNASQVAVDFYGGGLGCDITESMEPVVFDSQVPGDIDSANLFGVRLNLTYNFSEAPATADVYYKVFGSVLNNTFFVNGTKVSDSFLVVGADSNVSDKYLFRLADNEIYPAVYNYNETYMELTPKSEYVLDSSTDVLFTSLLGVRSDAAYNQLEFYASPLSSVANTLRVYYCNSSYVFGTSLTTSAFCAAVTEVSATQAYNHSHGHSFHYLLNFPVVDGEFSGVGVSDKSYFGLLGRNGLYWNVSFIPEQLRDVLTFSPDLGVTVSNLSGTSDLHLHQYDGTEEFCYLGSNGDFNTSLSCDAIGFVDQPPNSPILDYPRDDYYNEFLVFSNWTAPFASNISYYNVSLFNASDNSFLRFVGTSSDTNISVNLSGFLSSNFSVRVVAVDNDSRVSSPGVSLVFGLDLVFPTLITSSPQNNSVISNGSITFDWTGVDDNAIWSFDVWCSGANSYEFHVSNLTGKTYNFVGQANFSGVGSNLCVVQVKDSHTARDIGVWDNRESVGNYSEKTLLFNDRLRVVVGEDVLDYGIGFRSRADRYSWFVVMDMDRDKLTFPVDDGCVRVYGSPFKGHLVCYDSMWQDFENDLGAPVYFDRDNVIVDLQFTKEVSGQIINFESVGELNAINYSVVFNTSYGAPLFSGEGFYSRFVCADTLTSTLLILGCAFLFMAMFTVGLMYLRWIAVMAGFGMLFTGFFVVPCMIMVGVVVVISGVLMVVFTFMSID